MLNFNFSFNFISSLDPIISGIINVIIALVLFNFLSKPNNIKNSHQELLLSDIKSIHEKIKEIKSKFYEKNYNQADEILIDIEFLYRLYEEFNDLYRSQDKVYIKDQYFFEFKKSINSIFLKSTGDSVNKEGKGFYIDSTDRLEIKTLINASLFKLYKLRSEVLEA